MPELHVSMPLQAAPSEQLVPSRTGTCRQPSVERQLSCVQTLASSQLVGSLVHDPATHRSCTVHASPSVQSASVWQQPATASCVHPVDGSHPSAVQGLPSSHRGATPAVQLPL